MSWPQLGRTFSSARYRAFSNAAKQKFLYKEIGKSRAPYADMEANCDNSADEELQRAITLSLQPPAKRLRKETGGNVVIDLTSDEYDCDKKDYKGEQLNGNCSDNSGVGYSNIRDSNSGGSGADNRSYGDYNTDIKSSSSRSSSSSSSSFGKSRGNVSFSDQLLSSDYLRDIRFDEWAVISRSNGNTSEDEVLYYLNSKSNIDAKRGMFFDLDGNLIVTRSGGTFGKGVDDWKLFSDGVLRELHARKHDHYFAIISNQNGVNRFGGKMEELKTKLDRIFKHIGIPFDFVGGLSKVSYFRKPLIGSLEFLVRARGLLCYSPSSADNISTNSNFAAGGGEENVASTMIYVGDAAGRPGDFSDSDLKFAVNASMEFLTPEMLFLGDKTKVALDIGKELRLSQMGDRLPYHSSKDSIFETSDERMRKCNDNKATGIPHEIILLVGPRCCGKSTIAELFKGREYAVIQADKFNSSTDALINVFGSRLRHLGDNAGAGMGKSFVVDCNDLVDQKQRQKWINLVNKLNQGDVIMTNQVSYIIKRLAENRRLGVRCILFDIPKVICSQLNKVRDLKSQSAFRLDGDFFRLSLGASVVDNKFEKELTKSFEVLKSNLPNNSEGLVCVTTIGWEPIFTSRNNSSCDGSNKVSTVLSSFYYSDK